MMVIQVLDKVRPNSLSKMTDINGVATEKVVAVPARRAKTANRSMNLPSSPSVCFPNNGLQASEYFCLSLFLTWSMNPKATAKTK